MEFQTKFATFGLSIPYVNMSTKTKILNYLLALLGFAAATSCDEAGNLIIGMAAEYGTPTMDFEVSGKVVDQNSAPIEGIQVRCMTYDAPGHSTTLTAKDGSFSISGKSMSALLEFSDIDGPENGGEFATKMENIEVKKIGDGDGRWYMGKFEAKGVVIDMEEKK